MLKWSEDRDENDAFCGIWSADSSLCDDEGNNLAYAISVREDGRFYLDLSDDPLADDAPFFDTFAGAKEWCEETEAELVKKASAAGHDEGA